MVKFTSTQATVREATGLGAGADAFGEHTAYVSITCYFDGLTQKQKDALIALVNSKKQISLTLTDFE